MITLQDLQAFEADTAAVVPGFRIAWKNESTFQKLVGLFAKPFNPDYCTKYTTTIGSTVYFPSRQFYELDPRRSFAILAHERVHLLDSKKHPFWFPVSYAFPQILFLPLVVMGVVLAFFVGWWSLLAFGLALVTLGPWPAPGRVHWEQRGYAMSMACAFWLFGGILSFQKESIRKQFLGWAYFRMSWREAAVDDWLSRTEKSIRSGVLPVIDSTYGDVLKFLRASGNVS